MRLWDVYAGVRRWTSRAASGDGIRLYEGRDHAHRIDHFADHHGGRVGLAAVLEDLDRQACVIDVPATAAEHGFAWDADDQADREWWPQGITTSADASDTDDVGARKVVVVAWYAKRVKGRTRGVRLSVVDVTDSDRPRYRHVLLVEPRPRWFTRRLALRPVPIHAGGIVWYGPAILVADTMGGLRVFECDDILRVEGGWDGFDYVIPQRTSYRAVNDRGFSPFKFSFVSLDRSGHEHQLIAGEYGPTGTTNRLIRFAFDARRAALALEEGSSRPLEIVLDGLDHMQGATVVDGTYYISTSRGRKPGSLWIRRSGEPAVEQRGVLSVGPEDLSYWPSTDMLWNCSEHVGQRYVYAVSRPPSDTSD